MNKSNLPNCESEAAACPTTWSPLKGYERPKFDLNFLCWLIGLAVIWLAVAPWLNWYSLAVFTVMELTFLFGCWRTRWATLAIVPAMVAPYIWIFANQVHGWDEYRRLWLAKLFELPGMVTPVVMRTLGAGGEIQDGLASAITAALLFLLLVTGARINRQWLLAMAFLCLNLNLLSSLVAWAMYKQG
jgi:hypothetical protein